MNWIEIILIILCMVGWSIYLYKSNPPVVPWDWERLSKNPNIKWVMFEENKSNPPVVPWDWERLSKNPNITWEMFEENKIE